MVGDNYQADVVGAERAGIPAILVRSEHPEAQRRAEDLVDSAAIISSFRDPSTVRDPSTQ
jgi:ribonucleotide monophosphatase NagD (HAD superfamily)